MEQEAFSCVAFLLQSQWKATGNIIRIDNCTHALVRSPVSRHLSCSQVPHELDDMLLDSSQQHYLLWKLGVTWIFRNKDLVT